MNSDRLGMSRKAVQSDSLTLNVTTSCFFDPAMGSLRVVRHPCILLYITHGAIGQRYPAVE